MQINSLIIS